MGLLLNFWNDSFGSCDHISYLYFLHFSSVAFLQYIYFWHHKSSKRKQGSNIVHVQQFKVHLIQRFNSSGKRGSLRGLLDSEDEGITKLWNISVLFTSHQDITS
jgi:hypothetical protein